MTRRSRDRGSSTVELAVSLPAIAMLLVVGIGALAVVRDQIECVDVAREAARAAARGEPLPAVSDTSLSVNVEGDLVQVTARRHRVILGHSFEIVETAVAAAEPA